MSFWLREDLQLAWQGRDPFAMAANQQGQVLRSKEGRRTLAFATDRGRYFLKYHAGVGWQEIIKNLLHLKRPILSAMNEVEAIRRVRQAGLDTLNIAGYGQRGWNPAKVESFLITDELEDCLSLEEVASHWQGRPPPQQKRRLIRRLGEIARRLHAAGINHRDFYICHFLIKRAEFEVGNLEAQLHLIDLHRAQWRKAVPVRWLLKDLGGLYFSAAPWRLTRTDLLRFIAAYSGTSAAKVLRSKRPFWMSVAKEGARLYERAYKEKASHPLPYQEPLD